MFIYLGVRLNGRDFIGYIQRSIYGLSGLGLRIVIENEIEKLAGNASNSIDISLLGIKYLSEYESGNKLIRLKQVYNVSFIFVLVYFKL